MPAATTTLLHARLRPEVDAPQAARSAVSQLDDEIEPEVLRELALVVSELVTNSVRHAGLRPQEKISLRVQAGPDRVRVAVADPGGGFAAPATPEPTGESGWGLFLVERLAARWGVEVGQGTLVWAELERPH